MLLPGDDGSLRSRVNNGERSAEGANKLLSCAAAVENTDAFYKVSSFLSGVRDCRTIGR